MFLRLIYLFFLSAIPLIANCQFESTLWHDKERVIHYLPQGTDFIKVNGKLRFNRALYGTNTGFRIETGDLPEFALYMPGMGGNFKFGLIAGTASKWLIDADSIKTVYRPGSMLYEIKDALMGGGVLRITVLALADREGVIIQTQFTNVTTKAELCWAFGGATGKRFSRDGDIGADPESSFYLKAENCKDNRFLVEKNNFRLEYGGTKQLFGIAPPSSINKIANAAVQQSPVTLYTSTGDTTPAITGKLPVTNTTEYFLIQQPITPFYTYPQLAQQFQLAENSRKTLANRIKVVTPDPFINTLGGALSIAADAIWESPTYLHGAVAWRMRLPAWRGAYVADVLGWHDRARTHFSSYALSQVTEPETAAVVMDTALHLARHLEKIGTGMFTSGYICRNPNGDIRPHHYDMNLVFIDQLLNHFYWTGDTAYIRSMWPVLERHFAWEKRNFDADGDGLYDAYCCIWASDGLQYSGGGVTHSSAYNYRANRTMAELATLIGKEGSAYKKEADKILTALNTILWIPSTGNYAEYKDLLGEQLVHPVPGLWTLYHALDAQVPDAFKAYQSLRYIDKEIPHIPVVVDGLLDRDLYQLSTSNWQPYTWSVNNVALAENLHTALAYWQGNRPEEAYRLWKSNIVESMYVSSSPGGFQQLSFYDAIRGELYRDFADPIGMAGRTLVEGLFGVQPDLLHNAITIKPGLPAEWNYATLQTPDITIDFKRTDTIDQYVINSALPGQNTLNLLLTAAYDGIASIQVNGQPVTWKVINESVGQPVIQFSAGKAARYTIRVNWKGNAPELLKCNTVYQSGDQLSVTSTKAILKQVYDPQQALTTKKITANKLQATIASLRGNKTVFVQLQQGALTWWSPLCFKNLGPLQVPVPGEEFPPKKIVEKIDLTRYYNDKVSNIFKQQYLSPRPTSPTLQLPTQGIGNWCYPLTEAVINDSGLRKQAGAANEIVLPPGIPFHTPGDSTLKNIVFTSQWDNYPKTVSIKLSGKASHVYVLMAGSTNPMQSHITNGQLVFTYTNGTADTLSLINPVNWWPIEQDYYSDGYAFTTGRYWPQRYYLKQGIAANLYNSAYTTIRGFSNRGIDGGAATMLDFPLDASKELRSVTLRAICNDVVIGLMSLTLQRN